MLRAPLPLLSVLLVAALSAGCSTFNEDKTAGWSPDKIFSDARDEMNGGAYETRTMAAMALRTTVWLAIGALAWRLRSGRTV